MTLKSGTTIMISPFIYSLRQNEFFVYDIFENLPDHYWDKKSCIYKIPAEIKTHGVIIFSGKIKGLQYPYGVSIRPEDVFVGFNKSGSKNVFGQEEDFDDDLMEVHQVFPGQCIIACSFFCMLIEQEKLDQYFTCNDFFKQPLNLN